ncbi:FAD-dependent oxidoreductase [Novacetimonas pomaceti]|uniref:FAD-linked oxidoreductase n=1 Tax=Novacetimonas pomaceti TaxID=2021998 RepID=A0ABX5P062_9PROT|nr:FAD-binding oxidoreductase [Novacetimonas pomaceti]PYD47122.1 FAD-linked oxidoreductase [Novacetimonas pomaceti]
MGGKTTSGRTELPRRALLGIGAALPFLGTPASQGVARADTRSAPGAWPDEAAWQSLRAQVGGRLSAIAAPDFNDPQLAGQLSSPFFIRDQAALTQSSGWVDGWQAAPGAYVVRARDASDVAATVRFAARHGVRPVIRGGGHSYLGGSNAAGGLLVWTRDMNGIVMHDRFVPAGSQAAPVQAVSLGAGCIWLEAYDAVTTRAGRYVQGGGCTTVGVAGFVQGGGFGSFSKQYGTGAGSLLEAEIVTADGRVRTVNDAREPDLFRALKGGGGGTFGVLTRLTLQTHPLPATFGLVHWQVRARSDAGFRRLLAAFVDTYATRLFNRHWGEQARAGSGNRLELFMTLQDLDARAARECWRDLERFVADNAREYEIEAPFELTVLPARRIWDGDWLRLHAPSLVMADTRPGASPGQWWWAGNTGEVGTFWHGYQSMWLPASLLDRGRRAAFADAWFASSRHWPVSLHFNKGLAGGTEEAIMRTRQTVMNPQVLDAFALAIIAGEGKPAYAGVSGEALAQARSDRERIDRASARLRRIVPGAGSYISESDYHLAGWRQACWGAHYEHLARVRRRYDPQGLFRVHHGVGT